MRSSGCCRAPHRARLLRRLPGRPQRPRIGAARPLASAKRGLARVPVRPPAGVREQRLHLTQPGDLSARPPPARGRSNGCTIPSTWCPPPSRTRSTFLLRVPRRGCGRLAAERRGVRVGRSGRPPDAGGPRRRPPDRGRRRPVHEPAREAGRRGPCGRSHIVLYGHARSTTPGTAPPPRCSWDTPGTASQPATGCGCRSPPATTPCRVGAPGDLREPVVCDPNGGQPPAPADRRRDAELSRLSS